MSYAPDVYYIVGDFGRHGRETVIDWERCSRSDVIHRMLTQQVDRPLEVHCIDREAGKWRDVSFEIAEELLNNLHEMPIGGLSDFLENTLGFRTMAEFERELEAA